VRLGDLVRTHQFGTGIVIEVIFDNCRIFYADKGRWYWEHLDFVEVISESR